ncbi:hypothetical protein F4808DRAFT_186360 [Astrocystis sublimbata]|nr:hypothetical protein F4808DRAFT_186360 [Astrocystis sublimbata]
MQVKGVHRFRKTQGLITSMTSRDPFGINTLRHCACQRRYEARGDLVATYVMVSLVLVGWTTSACIVLLKCRVSTLMIKHVEHGVLSVSRTLDRNTPICQSERREGRYRTVCVPPLAITMDVYIQAVFSRPNSAPDQSAQRPASNGCVYCTPYAFFTAYSTHTLDSKRSQCLDRLVSPEKPSLLQALKLWRRIQGPGLARLARDTEQHTCTTSRPPSPPSARLSNSSAKS